MIMTNGIKRENKLKVAHKLTRIIVRKTNVNYQAQFGICLKFVCNSYKIDILKAFILWIKKENELKHLNGFSTISKYLKNDGYFFIYSYIDNEIYYSIKEDKFIIVSNGERKWGIEYYINYINSDRVSNNGLCSIEISSPSFEFCNKRIELNDIA